MFDRWNKRTEDGEVIPMCQHAYAGDIKKLEHVCSKDTYLRNILFVALFSSLNTLEVFLSPSSIIQPLWIVPPSFLSEVFTSIS